MPDEGEHRFPSEFLAMDRCYVSSSPRSASSRTGASRTRSAWRPYLYIIHTGTFTVLCESLQTRFLNAANAVTSVTFESILTKLQSLRGECSVPARDKVEVRGLRDRVHPDIADCYVASRFCTNSLWRLVSECRSISRNACRFLESPHRSQESQIVLGSSGTGLRHVVLLPGALDLFRSLLTPRVAEPIRGRCRPLPAYCSYDGRGGGAASPPAGRTCAARGIP